MDAYHAKCAECVHITQGTVQKRRHRMGEGGIRPLQKKYVRVPLKNFGRKSVTNILEILVENQSQKIVPWWRRMAPYGAIWRRQHVKIVVIFFFEIWNFF